MSTFDRVLARTLVVLTALSLFAAACADEAPVPGEEPFIDHEESADFESLEGSGYKRDIGLPGAFDRHNVMSDAFFTNVDAVDAEGMQRFLERTPYGTRSWLAGARINGVPASQAIVTASRAAGVNPIVMLARMQAESSLVAKTANPGSSRTDYAFGCGCPDGRACSAQYRGLDKQIQCAGETLSGWYTRSTIGTGIFNKGVAKRTLDPLTVTPSNHATASLYTYTPWVLQGRGGNWLVWNITRNYALHFDALGELSDPGTTPEAPPLVEMTPMGVQWAFHGDARTADFAASAPEGIARVDYFVEGYHIGSGVREQGFALTYRFNAQKPDRELDVLGFDDAGKQIGLATGKIDSDGGSGFFIRQAGPQTFEIGLERPPAGAAFIEVKTDGVLLTDSVTGATRSDRRAVMTTFNQLGVRRIEISTFNPDGSYRGTLRRDFEVW